MLLACPIIGWCRAAGESEEKEREEERDTKRKGTNKISCNKTKCRCHASTSPAGFSGRFHIRLQAEATQTFECKETEGV